MVLNDTHSKHNKLDLAKSELVTAVLLINTKLLPNLINMLLMLVQI